MRQTRRIEMHLRSTQPRRRVTIRAAGFECDLRKDETIWTESCHKFHPGEICEIAAHAPASLRAQWIDETWPFAESLLIV